MDLHIERIPGSDGIPEWAARDFQMNYFRQVLRQNLKHKGKRIIFIHEEKDIILHKNVLAEDVYPNILACLYGRAPVSYWRFLQS